MCLCCSVADLVFFFSFYVCAQVWVYGRGVQTSSTLHPNLCILSLVVLSAVVPFLAGDTLASFFVANEWTGTHSYTLIHNTCTHYTQGELTEDNLREHFGQYGEITDCIVSWQ